MASLDELPIDTKIELLGFMRSRGDLESLCTASRMFYGIKHTKFWGSIERSVIEIEAMTGLTAELHGLWKTRKLKSEHTSQQLDAMTGLQDLPNYDSPVVSREKLDELVELRQTIRWFAVRFLKHYFAQRPAPLAKSEPNPSATELARVEDAFCLVWLWMEACYDFRSREYSTIGCFIRDWALQGPYPQALNNFATLYSVHRYLVTELALLCDEYASTIPREHIQLLSVFRGCMAQYISDRLPNLMLIELGLDGVRKLLNDNHGEKQKTVARCFRFAHLPQPRHWAVLDLWAFSGISYFVYFKKTSWLSLAFGTLKYHSVSESFQGVAIQHVLLEPQYLPPGFDPTVAFWDEGRQQRWGYRHPQGVYMVSLSAMLQRTFTRVRQTCRSCCPEWFCEDRSVWDIMSQQSLTLAGVAQLLGLPYW